MFPAAVGIVVASFPLRERGKAMAIFFGISGGLTAIGPIAGGFLTQWTWRAIFWINIPVAIIALYPDLASRSPTTSGTRRSSTTAGRVLITGAMGLIVLGLQQSSVWGWSSVATWVCIVVGFAADGRVHRRELRTPEPLLRLQIFRDRGFADRDRRARPDVDRVRSVLLLRQRLRAGVAGQDRVERGRVHPVLLHRIRDRGPDRWPDSRQARRQAGRRLRAARSARSGFFLLAGKLTDLSLGAQWLDIMIAGAGLGLMLGPASTDAVNRAPSTSYSEVTGITQTARNFGASLGLAILGAILVSRRTRPTSRCADQVTACPARSPTRSPLRSAPAASGSQAARACPCHSCTTSRLAFAQSTQTIFYIMAGVMAATFLVAVRWLPRGRVVAPEEQAVAAARDSPRSRTRL